MIQFIFKLIFLDDRNSVDKHRYLKPFIRSYIFIDLQKSKIRILASRALIYLKLNKFWNKMLNIQFIIDLDSLQDTLQNGTYIDE